MTQTLSRITFFVALAIAWHPVAWASQRPNVIIILADDLGWSDTTLFGTTKLYKTPNLERLAKRGMTFSRAYSASPLCSPTRASLLTGLSPAKHGITAPNCHLPQVKLEVTIDKQAASNRPSVLPQPVTRLSTDYPTLPKTLKAAGYASGHFGKWHLGNEPHSPLQHGFDVDVPHWNGPGPAGSFVAPWKYPDFDPDTPDQHIEDRMALEAVKFMEANQAKPFYLNYWMFSVHAPFNAKQDLIDMYRAIVNKDEAQRSPIYAAMVESMDNAVGTLLDTVDRLGIADNTIIIFSSDNGGNVYSIVEDTTPTNNAPLRGGKATMYEGGVRVPQIICWPGQTKPGTMSDVLTNTCDMFPTLIEMLDLPPAPGQKFDGISIVPALKGQPFERGPMFTYFPHDPPVPDWMPPSISVHTGDWKLIRLFACGENGNHRWKLFNLAKDIGEQKDLASQQPERVQSMDGMIDEFLTKSGTVVPITNPAFDPAKYKISEEGQPGAGHFAGQQKKRKASGKTVKGWNPSGDCELAFEQGKLTVNSFRGDPFLCYKLPHSVHATTLTLSFSVNSDSKGEGRVFWQQTGVNPIYSAANSALVNIFHDGKIHSYKIRIEASKPIESIRIDPSTNAGTIVLSDISVMTESGKKVNLLPPSSK